MSLIKISSYVPFRDALSVSKSLMIIKGQKCLAELLFSVLKGNGHGDVQWTFHLFLGSCLDKFRPRNKLRLPIQCLKQRR